MNLEQCAQKLAELDAVLRVAADTLAKEEDKWERVKMKGKIDAVLDERLLIARRLRELSETSTRTTVTIT